MGYFTAPRIAFGPSAIEQLGNLGARRALVLVDPAIARATRTLRATEELAKVGTAVETVATGTSDATVASIEPLLARATAFGPDWIVAIGGGRTIDSAKGLWARYGHPDVPLSSVSPLAELDLRARARFAALPTTCGSGSESTWVAYLKGEGGTIVEIASRELAPDWAIVDPTFLETLPTPEAAATAAGAVAHAFEAFVSAWSNPFSDALALQAMTTAVPAIAKLAKHRDAEVEAALHLAATQAGLAAANAQVGLTHALATSLSVEFDVPHARLVAALLPFVAEFHYPSARDRYAPLAAVFGGSAASSRSAIPERLRAVWDAAGLPRTLADAGVAAEALEPAIERVARRTLASPGAMSSPRIPSDPELAELLRAALRGTPVGF